MPGGRIFAGEQIAKQLFLQGSFLVHLGILKRNHLMGRHAEMADGQPIDLTIWLFLRYIRL